MKNIRLESLEQLIFYMKAKEMVLVECDDTIEIGIIEQATEVIVKVNGYYFMRDNCKVFYTLTTTK